MTRVLVVGADAAGMSAAHQALRTAGRNGRTLEIVALERTGDTSYSACGLPYWIAGDVGGSGELVARTPDRHRQIVGGRGAGKRIDTAAAALWNAATVDDLASMDLAYAPPFATVWEAVQLAARRLADRL